MLRRQLRTTSVAIRNGSAQAARCRWYRFVSSAGAHQLGASIYANGSWSGVTAPTTATASAKLRARTQKVLIGRMKLTADSADDVPVGWLLEYLGTCGYPLMLRVRGEASCSSCGPAGSPAERRVRAPYVRRADTRPDPKARPADRTAPRAPGRDRSRPCGPGRIPAGRHRRCAGQPRHCPAAGRRASRAGGTRSAGDHPPLRLWDEALALVVRVAADDLESRSETAQKPDYRTNTPAWLARSRKYCGATPSTSVTATPTAIVVIVSGDGTATVGPSAFGSLKNIRTITRM